MKPSDIRILVVDDEPLILESVSYLFKSFQFNVDTAPSGNIAWTFLERNSYDLILSDIRMADGDGLELVKKVKARNVIKPGFLFMTGFSDVLNEQIYHLGAEGKFTKPFNISAVRTAIEACLLAPEAKWAQALPSSKMMTIEKRARTLASLEHEKLVIFGRGGFFIEHSFSLPEKGKSISFTIKVESPTPMTFQGVGVIRWTQTSGKANVPQGLGIEITHLPIDQAKIYNELFGKKISFIPSLAKKGQDNFAA